MLSYRGMVEEKCQREDPGEYVIYGGITRYVDGKSIE